MHTSNYLIEGNTIESYGHSTLFENKTTQERTNYLMTNAIFRDNIIKSDGTFVRMFGTYGSTEGNESGFQNVLISGNQMLVDSDLKAIDISHYHSVDINHNTFYRVDAQAIGQIVNVANTRFVDITFNTLRRGNFAATDVLLVDTATFSSKFGYLNISDNKFDNVEDGTSTYHISINNCAVIDSVSINNNKFYAGDSAGARAVRIANSSVNLLQVEGNTYIAPSGGNISTASSSITASRLRGNSWGDPTEFEQLYLYRTVQDVNFVSGSYTLPIVNNNELIDLFPITTDSELILPVDSSRINYLFKKIRNSGTKVLTISTPTLGVLLIYPRESLEIMSYNSDFRLFCQNSVKNSTGPSTSRPTVVSPGYVYYDSTLSKIIFYTGTAWVDATGTEV
jgi:hypothetical protein